MRVEVRALIEVEGGIVVTEETRQGQPHSALPGGRVEQWENLEDALVREVLEETGLVVEPGRLVYVFEVVARHRLHDLDLVFLADLREVREPRPYRIVRPEEGGAILPPILGEIAQDRDRGWPDNRGWLGNIYTTELPRRSD